MAKRSRVDVSNARKLRAVRRDMARKRSIENQRNDKIAGIANATERIEALVSELTSLIHDRHLPACNAWIENENTIAMKQRKEDLEGRIASVDAGRQPVDVPSYVYDYAKIVDTIATQTRIFEACDHEREMEEKYAIQAKLLNRHTLLKTMKVLKTPEFTVSDAESVLSSLLHHMESLAESLEDWKDDLEDPLYVAYMT